MTCHDNPIFGIIGAKVCRGKTCVNLDEYKYLPMQSIPNGEMCVRIHRDWHMAVRALSLAPIVIVLLSCRQYLIVTNPDQRNRYKNEFNVEYQEYKSLFDYSERVNKAFSSLADKLHAAPPESSKYKVRHI